MTTELDDEACDHAATFAYELLTGEGWEPQTFSADEITRKILRSYLRRKAEIDAEVEGATERVVTRFVHPPIPDRRWDWCAYHRGEEEAGNYGWGRTAQEAVEALEAINAEA